MQRPTVVEPNELMLSAAFDGEDTGVLQRPECGGRYSPRQTRVQQPDECNPLPSNRLVKSTSRALDFWQFRHVKRPGPLGSNRQSALLSSGPSRSGVACVLPRLASTTCPPRLEPS